MKFAGIEERRKKKKEDGPGRTAISAEAAHW